MEFTKPVSTIRTDSPPKGIYVLDSFGIIIIGCKTNTYFLEFEKNDDQYFYNQIGYIPHSCCVFADKNGSVLLGSRNGKILKISMSRNKVKKS